ncbi:hypothetical protein AOQ84DRAFT_430784 [Glonium stellatum]|uniref:Zn(2)-C6 fungal-type domain-containing protein n=1 Tax=Glonium stellatum TaxID=574774 RepID=A0A8E2F525_9PEZI|nr:hypothetical protein AOQ84DRAFT_430784 [Glonium stellatum]
MIPYRTESPKQIRGPSSRSKLACNQCRDRHVKCDQQHPCGICRRRKVECYYGDKSVFRALEWKPEIEYAQPTREALDSLHYDGVSPSGRFTFIDETPKIAEHYEVLPSPRFSAHNSPSGLIITGRNSKEYSIEECGPAVGTLTLLTELGKPIAEETDAFYMGIYTDVIGPWFDLFDGSSRHFSAHVPQLALSNRLLLLSCLAAAARQHSLVTSHGHDDALTYYNQALRLLYQQLNNAGHEPATFASCLLVAHCEMIESKASDWYLHLKGTGELVAIRNWSGASGGLVQACFWIYCRMIILASLSSGTPTPLDSAKWIPHPNYLDITSYTLESWSSKVVYLLGSVHNLLCRGRDIRDPNALGLLTREWSDLKDQLAQHEASRPTICNPLSILPAKPGDERPFQAIHYLDGSVAAAWQMFHTASFLTTISMPCLPEDRLSKLSSSDVAELALAFARKIVSNSIANRGQIAWVNAVQLLTTAGQCLCDWRERKACARILEDIERVTGWQTKANVRRLLLAWNWDKAEINWRNVEGNLKQEDLGLLLYRVWQGDSA